MLFVDFHYSIAFSFEKMWYIHYTKHCFERTLHRSMMYKWEVPAVTAVIYARYSWDNQREESIEGQIRECTAYAEKRLHCGEALH